MPQVELSQVDVQNLLAIINAADIKGNMAETIASLKMKLNAIPKPEAQLQKDNAPEK